MHHFGGMVKKPLIVRAERSAVGDHQRLLARAPCPAAALGVVGRGGRHIAQVHSVEGRNIDAQLHCGRAEHDGQALQWRLVHGIGQPVFAVFFGVAKALLQQLAAGGIDLRGVLLRLKVEQGVPLLAQDVGHSQIKTTEKLVVLTVFKGLRLIDQHPVHAGGVEAPANNRPFHVELVHVAVM